MGLYGGLHVTCRHHENRVMDSVRSIRGVLVTVATIGLGLLRVFFQNNTNFQTILLVNIISKLFKKLSSRAFETRVHYSNSSITNSISMKFTLNSSL